jgi:ribosomal protein L40E
MVAHPHFSFNIDKVLNPKKKRIGVWARKSDDEIKLEQVKIKKSAYSLTMPIGAVFIVNYASILVIDSFKWWKFYHSLLISLLVFVSIYLLQIINGRSFAKSPRFKICRNCFSENWIGANQCHCGGELEPVEFYYFIEKGK